jgi:hypothetical protein
MLYLKNLIQLEKQFDSVDTLAFRLGSIHITKVQFSSVRTRAIKLKSV